MNFGEAFVTSGYITMVVIIIFIVVLMINEWFRPDREHLSNSNWNDDQPPV